MLHVHLPDGVVMFFLLHPVHQIRRILRPGGHVVVLETLGTAVEAPQRNSYFYRMMEDMGLYVYRVVVVGLQSRFCSGV